MSGAKKTGDFRFAAKNVLLTFPRCSLPPKELFDWIKKTWNTKYVCIGQEHHEDGGLHLHCYIQFKQKFDSKDVRVFDYAGHHPNITPPNQYSSPAKGRAYCKKEGWQVVEDNWENLDLEDIEVGKRKQAFLDWEWYQNHKVLKSMIDIIWPIKIDFMDEMQENQTLTMTQPDPGIKDRNIWIVGPPNAGKTFWAQTRFAGQKVFMPGRDFPFEGYQDEELILYDDNAPKNFNELSNILNTYAIPMRIAGNHRYSTKYWKIGSTRSIIVLSNKTIQEFYEIDKQKKLKDDHEYAAYVARFTQIQVKCMGHAEFENATAPPSPYTLATTEHFFYEPHQEEEEA